MLYLETKGMQCFIIAQQYYSNKDWKVIAHLPHKSRKGPETDVRLLGGFETVSLSEWFSNVML